jgi:hypothetical protein
MRPERMPPSTINLDLRPTWSPDGLHLGSRDVHEVDGKWTTEVFCVSPSDELPAVNVTKTDSRPSGDANVTASAHNASGMRVWPVRRRRHRSNRRRLLSRSPGTSAGFLVFIGCPPQATASTAKDTRPPKKNFMHACRKHNSHSLANHLLTSAFSFKGLANEFRFDDGRRRNSWPSRQAVAVASRTKASPRGRACRTRGNQLHGAPYRRSGRRDQGQPNVRSCRPRGRCGLGKKRQDLRGPRAHLHRGSGRATDPARCHRSRPHHAAQPPRRFHLQHQPNLRLAEHQRPDPAVHPPKGPGRCRSRTRRATTWARSSASPSS